MGGKPDRPGRRLPRGKRDVLPGSVRSCAACRARAPRGDLLRFVLVDGKVVFDRDRRLGGRGLNLGPSPLCIERAQKKGAFQRQWRLGLSPEDARVLAAEVGLALRDRLGHWLADAFARGALAPVDGVSAVEPASLRVLWEEVALADVVGGVPPSSPRTPRAAAKMAALVRAAWQFTLVRAGDTKRRPEPADICPALAPDTGQGRANRASGAACAASGESAEARGREEFDGPEEGLMFASISAVGAPAADGSGRTLLEAGASLTRRPSGGSE